MNGFERRREQKMEAIRSAALKLFSLHGIKAVSIAEIAKEANVSQVSIYNFFESKHELAKQAFFTFMDEKMLILEDLLQTDGISLQQKVGTIFQISMESVDELHQEFNQSNIMKDPAILNFLQEYKQNKTIPLFIELINQGKNEGIIDKDLSMESVQLYINSINTVLQSPVSTKTRKDFGKLFLYGLFGLGDNHHP